MSVTELCGGKEVTPEPPPPDNRVPAEARNLVVSVLPKNIARNHTTRWGLEIQVATLLNNGTEPSDVEAALREWINTPDVYPGHLPHICTEIIKRKSHNGHVVSAVERKVAALDRIANKLTGRSSE